MPCNFLRVCEPSTGLTSEISSDKAFDYLSALLRVIEGINVILWSLLAFNLPSSRWGKVSVVSAVRRSCTVLVITCNAYTEHASCCE